jgi:hypothetical protein
MPSVHLMAARLTGSRWIAVALGLVLVAVATVVVLTVPSGEPPSRIAGIDQAPEGAAVIIGMEIDAVDAAGGTFKVRVQAVPGEAVSFPAEGVVIYTDISGIPAIKVTSDELPQTYNGVLDATSGEVSAYPFDRYKADFGLQVAAGTERTLAEALAQPTLPFAVIAESSAVGFDVTGTAEQSAAGTGEVTFEATRGTSTTWWAVGMMTINWLVALAAVGVVLTVLLRQRPWETRHLAWLGSLVFALSAFRNTAPGNPPIGTFLDFRSFFPAIGLIVLSLIALVLTFLVRSRDELDL